MATIAEPLVAAGAFFVIGVASLLAMNRNRFFAGFLALAALTFVFAVWDFTWNDSGAVFGTYLTFTVLAILFVVLAVITFLATNPREQPAPRTRTPGAAPTAVRRTKPATAPSSSSTLYYDFKGDVHKVIDVEGIGPIYAEKLQAIGIETTARLCYEDAGTIARRLEVPKKAVESWQHMAELAKVNGIGKQYAEALARSGIEGIDELKRRSPDRMAKAVNDYLAGLDVNVLGQRVTPKRIRSWQQKAKPMRRVRQKVPEA